MLRCFTITFAVLVFAVAIDILIFLYSDDDISINPRIVSGRPATTAEFAYMVSIRLQQTESDKLVRKHLCGGSIVDKYTVVTAAHCMFDAHILINPNSFTVVAGTNVLKPKQQNSQVRKVSKIYIHPNFSYETMEHDIAVLKVYPPFQLNGKNVASIGLQNDELEIGTKCSTHGWGFKSYNSKIGSNELLTINIPIYNHQNCLKAYKKLNTEVFNTTLCAGVPSGKKDTCNGDSGGPLICKGKLSGIVSFGIKCGYPNYPGIYTKISAYREYIEDLSQFYDPYVSEHPNTVIFLLCLIIVLIVLLIKQIWSYFTSQSTAESEPPRERDIRRVMAMRFAERRSRLFGPNNL